jgi:hypothetical protein
VTTAGPTTTAQSHTPATITVTDGDNGNGYTLRRGDHLIVELSGSFYDWTPPTSSNNGVLGRDSGFTRSDGSAHGSFSAIADGHATVSASGNPKCLKATPPCAVASQQFTVSVSVVG